MKSGAHVLMLAMLATPLAAQPPQLSWDFDLPDARWNFTKIMGPSDAFTTEARADGFAISPNHYDSFGFYETPVGHSSPPLHAANILAVRWVIGTSAASPEDVPDFRLRMTARDGSFTQTYIVQDAFKNDGHLSSVTPVSGRDLVFQTYTDVPASAVNGRGGDGFALAFDVMSFSRESGQRLNEDVVLKHVEVRALTPGDLGTNEGNVYEADFRSGDDGWSRSDTTIGGHRVEHTTHQNGIGIRTFGPGQGDPINDIHSFNFPYGWWTRQNAFTMREGRVYRVKLTVRVDPNDGTTNLDRSVPTRLRFATPYHDYVAEVQLGSQPATGDTDGNPSFDGRTFFAWIATPPGLGDVPVDLYWEVWQDLQPVPTGSSMILQDLEIKAWTAPDAEGDSDRHLHVGEGIASE